MKFSWKLGLALGLLPGSCSIGDLLAVCALTGARPLVSAACDCLRGVGSLAVLVSKLTEVLVGTAALGLLQMSLSRRDNMCEGLLLGALVAAGAS